MIKIGIYGELFECLKNLASYQTNKMKTKISENNFEAGITVNEL